MSLFIKVILPEDPPEKTPATAQEIYGKLIEHNGSESAVFSGGYGYPFSWIVQTKSHALNKEEEIIQYVKNNPSCTAGDVITNVTSVWLNMTTLGNDVIVYNPTYDLGRTFSEFKTWVLSQ